MSAPWRSLVFEYRIPEGADWADMEERMVESLTSILGCDHENPHNFVGPVECQCDWAATTGPSEAPE